MKIDVNYLKARLNKSIDIFLADTLKNYKVNSVSPALYQCIKDFLQREGKRIRPILYIVSYCGYAKNKKINFPKLLRSSLALELFHDFMLIHDDVIDKSYLRRGRPTLHILFNNKFGVSKKSQLGEHLSIIAGDIIFALAIDSFLQIDENLSRKQLALKKLVETAAFTGAGEFIDVVNSTKNIEQISQKSIYLNYLLKTAKYTFETPLLLGGILNGVPDKELKKLSKLGVNLGLAFQIQDDLLDIFSSSKSIGKPILSDLVESKKTLLLWQAYKKLNNNDKITIRRILKKEKKTNSDLLAFRDLIRKSKSQQYCFNKALSLLKTADSICRSLQMGSENRKIIQEFINKLFEKTKELKTILD
ncbi:MAG: polyprenyl synthetase family protein [Candidatus Omnitrophota bacterium]|jgi:geranylgeranyl diphosphate synthase type I|nr:MAG: polyprenyl synthetase family protein [Candidatus Omnitrophota bacterium]